MKVLVFGQNGQVAQALSKLEISKKSNWIFLGSNQVQFTDLKTIEVALRQHRPEVIINCAAYTQVDKAESESELCDQINAKAPQFIAEWAKGNNAVLIHFSTDYVYRGTGEQLWMEEDEPGPLNAYGRSKLEAEKAILKAGCAHYILRTSWVYSAGGTNFVRTMLRLAQDREELKIVSDQIGSPTSADEIARAVGHILGHPQFLNAKNYGIYNLAGQGLTSWSEFASAIFKFASEIESSFRKPRVIPILTEEYPTPARRPLNSRLSQSKIKAQFGWVSHPWELSLKAVLADLLQRKTGA